MKPSRTRTGPLADLGRPDAATPQARGDDPRAAVHAAKLAFEKYFLWKMRHGYVGLP
jgi:hypothetical protein